MPEMTYGEKALALMMLVGWQNFSLKIREDKTWYVELAHVDRHEGGLMSAHTSVSKSPEEAVEKAWEWATDSQYHLVTNSLRENWRAVKWNGFMWQDVPDVR